MLICDVSPALFPTDSGTPLIQAPLDTSMQRNKPSGRGFRLRIISHIVLPVLTLFSPVVQPLIPAPVPDEIHQAGREGRKGAEV